MNEKCRSHTHKLLLRQNVEPAALAAAFFLQQDGLGLAAAILEDDRMLGGAPARLLHADHAAHAPLRRVEDT